MGRQTAETFSSGNPDFVRYLTAYPGAAEQGCSLIRVENTSWDGAVSRDRCVQRRLRLVW